jgi:MtfA peptidase
MLAAAWQTWWRWRQARAEPARSIPDELWQRVLLAYPFLAGRSDDDQQLLRKRAGQFLARKEFAGVNGLEVTDAMAVAIAAQACLPILHLGLPAYDGFVGIVVHPDEVVARRSEMDEDGVVHEYDEPLTGEAMAGGPIMLAWADVAAAGESAAVGYNVVIHEFTHVLDMQDGQADGVPWLPDAAARRHWTGVLDAEWQTLCERLDAGAPVALDDYAAEGPEEFFAVTSEAFFVAPGLLHAEHPAMYRLLAGYFQQDPLAYRPPVASPGSG